MPWRLGSLPTITGFPFSFGLSTCSADTKGAYRSWINTYWSCAFVSLVTSVSVCQWLGSVILLHGIREGTRYGLTARVAMQLGMYIVKGSCCEGGVLSSKKPVITKPAASCPPI